MRIVACDGSVSGQCEYARSNTMPSRASASMFGVATRVAIRRQMIRPQRVDGDEDDRHAPHRLAAMTREQQEERQRETAVHRDGTW